MKELELCPFCGGEAKLKTWCDRWGNWSAKLYCINAYGKPKEERCYAEFFMRSTTKEGVIEEITSKWNKRPSPWHTGTPTEERWYLIATRFGGRIEYDSRKCTRIIDNNGNKCMRFDGCNPVLAWQKIELYKENKDGRTD